ncbi:MAG: RodZ domain-containing protein [Candidatus Rokuibacteriota bacterium]
MASLGPYLRELRERRGLSLEEMVRATRVAGRYLEALEAGDLRALPAPAFTRGFIRAWCQTVGVDAAEALSRYQAMSGAMPAASRPAVGAPGEHEVPARSRNRGAVLVSFVLLVVLGLALFAVTLVLQSGRDRAVRAGASPEPPVASVAPSASTSGIPVSAPPSDEAAVPGESPSASDRRSEPAAAPRPGAVAPTATLGPVPASPGPGSAAAGGTVASPYRLVARVSEPTWIRVRMEDRPATEETIPAGEIREWVSSAPFVLTIGNAGGVTLELNGRPLPPLGARGGVIPRLVIPPTGQ